MNPELLLAHFDRISDAPDTVPRLRGFILELAVRGKLVDQNPNDEPSSRLMKKIETARDRLGLAEGITNQGTGGFANGDVPFEIPPNWIWVQLGDLCSKTGSGSTPRGGKSVYLNKGVPFLRSQNVHDDSLRLDDVAYISHETHEKMSGTAVRPGDLLLNITGGSIGRCCLVASGLGQANVSQHVAIIRVALDGIQRFLHQLVLSPYFQSFVLSEQTGAGRGGLPKNRMDRIPVALPPLAEQHRIVAKVDELMALCDRLEGAQAEREVRRDRLAAASLHRLNQPVGAGDTQAFREHANFHLQHLPRLTTRPEHVKQLRQTILNLAVRGQLVPQDPKDAPATDLLKRIQGEKAKLLREGKINREKPPVPPSPDEVGFALRPGWEPARISQILVELQTGPFGSSLHESDYKKGGVPVINPASMKDGRLVPVDSMAIGPDTLERLATFKLRAGDIVMARRGEMGRCAVVTEREEGWLCGTGSLILRLPESVSPIFFATLIGSPFVREYLGGSAVGATMQNLNQSILLNLVIGLPPLAEQHRIVAKVDELMALCDRLGAQLATAQSESRRLLESVLYEALSTVREGRNQARS
jgi:type I restriction enzyme S subunit